MQNHTIKLALLHLCLFVFISAAEAQTETPPDASRYAGNDEAGLPSTTAAGLHKAGEEAMRKGDYERAALFFTKALEKKPADADIHFARAEAFERLKNFPVALADYDTVIAIDPEYSEVYFKRAELRRQKKDYAGAVSDLT